MERIDDRPVVTVPDADNEVARQPDAMDRDPQPTTDGDPEDRQGDGQSATAVEHP